jgi:hypothetical protein
MDKKISIKIPSVRIIWMISVSAGFVLGLARG